ncbi:MAG: SRPBCC domain-containing protein [Actinobacteria bacterium]|nr:SRPBCC domain-containing protein [Actinomycetota bacterium]
MSFDSIEREVRIEAPVETVWSIVTEPEQIARWFASSAEVDLRPGGDLLFKFDSGPPGRCWRWARRRRRRSRASCR